MELQYACQAQQNQGVEKVHAIWIWFGRFPKEYAPQNKEKDNDWNREGNTHKDFQTSRDSWFSEIHCSVRLIHDSKDTDSLSQFDQVPIPRSWHLRSP